MIELVSESRCIKCDICIRVCPTNVFERRVPVIERREDCQTCFMCDAWCPTDALFVAPQTTPVGANLVYRDEEELLRRGLLGSYRREIGWGRGLRKQPELDTRETLTVSPLGLEHRRAASMEEAQYDIGFSVAYSDEGEEADESPRCDGRASVTGGGSASAVGRDYKVVVGKAVNEDPRSVAGRAVSGAGALWRRVWMSRWTRVLGPVRILGAEFPGPIAASVTASVPDAPTMRGVGRLAVLRAWFPAAVAKVLPAAGCRSAGRCGRNVGVVRASLG